MAAPQNFRSAFNGFNREDVVRYLEYIHTKHNNQVSQLTADAESLRAQLESMQQAEPAIDPQLELQLALLEQEREQLLQQVEELTARCAGLTQELEESRAAQEAAQQAHARDELLRAEELEAYRRAERAERLARERADLLYRQTNGVLADATAKVDGVCAEVASVADQVMSQLGQLQSAVASSKRALQDAADTMYSLRPGSREL